MESDDNPLYIAYHDEELGSTPPLDDQALFELLCTGNLSGRSVLGNGTKQTPGFPRSLSWLSNSSSRRDDRSIGSLAGSAIIRNKLKIFATRVNLPKHFYDTRQSTALLSTIFGLLLRGKRSLTMFPIPQTPAKTPLSKNCVKISKNEVPGSQVQSRSCLFYKQQGWLMTTRMIGSGNSH